MCLRVLAFLVTLALTWTSLSILWSTTAAAHPLLYGTSSSSIAPRADVEKGLPIRLADIIPGVMDTLRRKYYTEPAHPKSIKLAAKTKTEDREKVISVQEWHEIPNSVAYALTLEREANTVKLEMIGTNIQVPVIVTGYFGIKHDKRFGENNKYYPDSTEQHYPFPPEHSYHAKTWIESGSYPILYVAPFEPSGWDFGTAVWTHILFILKDPHATAKHDFRSTVVQIAVANKGHSGMLFEEIDDDSKPLGEFQLLNKAQMGQQRRKTAFPNLRQVLAHESEEELYGKKIVHNR